MSSNTEPPAGPWIRAVLDRYESALVRYAARITGEVEAARDVVQDTFLRLCREEPAAVEDHLAQWLFTVCRNCALDARRKKVRMTQLGHRAANECENREAEVPAALERHDDAGHILRLLANLPAVQQEVVRLKFQNGLSYREISQITDLTVTNVGYLLHVAIQTLRAELNSKGSLTS